MSSYRFSEGSSLFRKSVLHRIRFGNTLRLKAEFPNSAASSLRTNDLPGSDRRPSRSLSAYPDQWTYHHHRRRLSNTPRLPTGTASADDLSYHMNMFGQKTLENIPTVLSIDSPTVPPPPIPTPILSSMDIPQLETSERSSIVLQRQQSRTHLPDCIYANSLTNPMNSIESNDIVRHRRKSTRKETSSNSKTDSVLSMQKLEIESESSSAWTNEGTTDIVTTTTATNLTNADAICTCQLLWQLERETESIDQFKLFFKRDDLNVDWDYVQGSSVV